MTAYLTRGELEQLCCVAQAAGREVTAVYATDFASWSKDDASPLTQADLRADAVIRKGLEAAFPGMFILSEESSSQAAQPQQTFFLVDPLDGTKEFLKRNDEFTVNIALVHGGEPIAGVVLAPALGELFYAARGLGAWLRTGEGAAVALKTAPSINTASLRVIGSRSHGGDALAAWLDRLDREYTFLAAGSSLKFCRIAQGAADIYPRLGPTSQWDTAAAQAVLQEAGGAVLDPQGQPLAYGLDRPVLNPHFIAVGDPRLLFPPLA
ncbi:MAG TPA: 3'(2'),5'-bisphosphate nucleotidase CysQ [Ramlibacter sp.]|nr:3'(2'),5'-bisphosphate nucleotidase CysQ [Ramlibacter sp.]